MTEVEELIKQAEAQLKKWRKPNPEPRLSKRSWQEVMDERPYPNINVSNP